MLASSQLPLFVHPSVRKKNTMLPRFCPTPWQEKVSKTSLPLFKAVCFVASERSLAIDADRGYSPPTPMPKSR